MKHIVSIIALAAMLCGCGGGAPATEKSEQTTNSEPVAQGPVFAPEKKETIVTRQPTANPMDDVMRFQGMVRFMIVVPEHIDAKTAEILQNKLMAIASVNGVAALGGDPGICMVPNLSLLSADVTATVPAKHKVTYNLSIYVGNLATGDIYGNVQKTILGVGDSRELAMINAVQSISANDNEYQQMLQQAEQSVIEYYNTNGDAVLAMAQGYLAANEFAQAMAILNGVPSVCQPLYNEAVALKSEILAKRFMANADELVAKMEAALGLARDNMNGYCAEAMSYYALIPANSPAKAKADQVYAAYIASLDPEAELNWQRECREWEAQEKEREQAREFNRWKEELAAQVAIHGQTELLKKYKLDESHNKRGAFWRFFYNKEE